MTHPIGEYNVRNKLKKTTTDDDEQITSDSEITTSDHNQQSHRIDTEESGVESCTNAVTATDGDDYFELAVVSQSARLFIMQSIYCRLKK